MQEAAKHLTKCRASDRDAQLAALKGATDRVARFVHAQALMSQDPAAAVVICQQLLQEAPQQQVCYVYGPL